MQSEKLTDPEELSKRTAPELYTKLIAAGYELHAIIKAIAWERRQPLVKQS